MPKTSKKQKMTLDNLAILIQREFIDSKNEISGVRNEIREGFIKISDEIIWIHGTLEVIQREIMEIKKKLENVIYRHEFEKLKDRIEEIEKKVGIKN